MNILLFLSTFIINGTAFINRFTHRYNTKLFSNLYNNPSKKIIHVWGANETNWNLPTDTKIEGGGQILCLENQTPGIFGIVTTYWNTGLDNLFTDTTDKLSRLFSLKKCYPCLT